MKLEEKIIMLRKKKNWSQEELAYQLGVSRQAVSKWESGLSMPDLDKIILMSQIFSVTTDTLIKDDLLLEMGPDVETVNDSKSMDKAEVYDFLNLTKKTGKNIALAISLCIISPITLLVLLAFSEHKNTLQESVATGIGIGILLVFVLIAVPIFIISGLKMKTYEFVDKSELLLRDDIKAEVQNMKKAYQNQYILLLTGGIFLCVLGIIPVVVTATLDSAGYIILYMVALMIAFVSVGVFMIIVSSIQNEAYQKLLQEAEYSIEHKKTHKAIEPISTAFWCLVTAGYMLASLLTHRWDITWIVWPVAGILYGVLYGIVEAVAKNKKK